MTSYGGDASAEGHMAFNFLWNEMGFLSPRSVVTLSHRLQEDDPVLGNCCCWGVSIFRKREWIPGVSVPQWIARSLFESWSFQVSTSQHHCCQDVSELAADGNCSHFGAWYFLLLNFLAPALVYVHGRFGASLISSAREAQQWWSQWAHKLSEFYKYLQSFLLMELPATGEAKGKTAHPSEPLERCSSGWHPKLRWSGFNPGHLFIDSWEAQLGEVLRGFLPCKGSTSQSHITKRWLFSSFTTNNQYRKFCCPS